MEHSYRFGDRSALIQHNNLSEPSRTIFNQEEEKQNNEMFDRMVYADETISYRYEEQASSVPSSSFAPPPPLPSRIGYYVFGDSRLPVYASPPPGYPVRMNQSDGHHSTYETHYHQHGGTTVYQYYSPSTPGYIPPSIDPVHLYSRPQKVELAQREPVVPRPSQPPMALLRPLTHALPKEYHQPTCPQYRPQPQFPSPPLQQQSEAPKALISDDNISGPPSVHRTKTSYDQATTYLLNTLFFETFGHGTKPSKRERSRIQRKTGISSRHLTYWLSNHKRRYKGELDAYRRLLADGKVHDYDSYNKYRNNHCVPELRDKNMREDTANDNFSSDDDVSTAAGENDETKVMDME
ncbi:hypothetical protein BJV82DRAFT_714723 [Fennellomyces sp. T-0311]|nr:hypothetical protein BJV82DRAFT_714723 [Fennellomyces sp. T-0311]